MTGLSESAGSWKIMPMRRPRTSRIPDSGSCSRSRPSSSTLPPTMPPASGSSRMIESAVMDLPQPGLPDQRESLAALDVE